MSAIISLSVFLGVEGDEGEGEGGEEEEGRGMCLGGVVGGTSRDMRVGKTRE